MDAPLFFQDARLVGQKKTKNTKNQIEAQIQNNKKKKDKELLGFGQIVLIRKYSPY